MLAHGFNVEQMVELVHDGLAITNAERMAVARVRSRRQSGSHLANDDAKQGAITGPWMSGICRICTLIVSHRSELVRPMSHRHLALDRVEVLGESAIMSISLGITAVAATMLMAVAMSGVYGGDYPAITQADLSIPKIISARSDDAIRTRLAR
jgi:hypothetical protein